MTEKTYKEAIAKRKKLTSQIEKLDEKILKYDNEFKMPEFWDIKDVRSFVMWEGTLGALFNFEDVTYEMVGTMAELEREYGCDSVQDGLWVSSIRDMEDSHGLIQKYKI